MSNQFIYLWCLQGEENLVIPIHAYPVMNAEDFPPQLTFPAVPVGHKYVLSFLYLVFTII